jgi:hypothetical protein
MRLSSLCLGTAVVVFALVQGACDTKGFGHPQGGHRLEVELHAGPKGPIADPSGDTTNILGSRLAPLPLTVDSPQPFRLVVRAYDRSGNPDPTFNGFVRISAKPGGIDGLAGDGTDGRNVKLTSGESAEIEVRVTNAYGTTYILADDLGYEPADALGDPPPACADGIDNDGDGLIDFPADDGCAFGNDGTETGGTYEQGASAPIFYRLPRIADARGLLCDANGANCTGAGKTPYPKEQIFLDTGYHDRRNPDGDIVQAFDFDMIVTRIAPDGFYVSDVGDPRGGDARNGFNNLYVYNFNPPPGMRVCDRLKTFAGTASEFFGMTQLSYPTWTLEEWDFAKRPCGVPEPIVLEPQDVPGDIDGDGKVDVPGTLLGRTAALVRVATQDGMTVMVTPKFGPGHLPCLDAAGRELDVPTCTTDPKSHFVTAADKGTDCDLNGDGSIDFTAGGVEARCSDACTLDPECTEYSNFVARSTFRITVANQNTRGAIMADATQSSEFKPLEMKGKPLRSFSGTLHFFSGGGQYTIEARCKDDIVVDPKAQPVPPDQACVFPRTVIDENPQ